MNPVIFVVAFVCYSGLVFMLKCVIYPKHSESRSNLLCRWSPGYEYALVISPDFWWANYFKDRIRQFEPDENVRADFLKAYVRSNNSMNFWVSLVFAVAVFSLHFFEKSSLLLKLLLVMAVIRMVSRSFEISYAFGKDVLQDSENSTGLTKFERVKLALVSYAEIFIYSAAAYLVLPIISCPTGAITMSLNVGTLANVGYAFAGTNVPFCVNFVFVQVFTTIGLVALSIASYLSRSK